MVKLGKYGEYHLLPRGRRPRSKWVRRLTCESAIRRIAALSVDETVRLRVLAVLGKTMPHGNDANYADLVRAGFREGRVALYREIPLSRACFLEPPVPLSDLLGDQGEGPDPTTPRPTWIAVRLVYPDGQPCRRARLEVRLVGGGRRSERVNEDGTWRADDVPSEGICDVRVLEAEPQDIDMNAEPPPGIRVVAAGGGVGLETGKTHVLIVDAGYELGVLFSRSWIDGGFTGQNDTRLVLENPQQNLRIVKSTREVSPYDDRNYLMTFESIRPGGRFSLFVDYGGRRRVPVFVDVPFDALEGTPEEHDFCVADWPCTSSSDDELRCEDPRFSSASEPREHFFFAP